MKKLFQLLLVTAFMLVVSAPDMVAQDAQHKEVFLSFRGGVGYGIFRDLGASPLTYCGPELLPAFAVEIRRPEWRYKAGLQVVAGTYGYKLKSLALNMFGGNATLSFEALCRCFDSPRWQIWAGLAADDCFDIRYNAQLGNSCTGIGNFVRLHLTGRGEFVLSRWTFHGQLSFAPIALALRPGYAYIANYDRDISNPVANTFEQYGTYVVGACSLMTDLGATYHFTNGNWLSLSYRWGHLTSRTSEACPWRFDAAGHAFAFAFGFKL